VCPRPRRHQPAPVGRGPSYGGQAPWGHVADLYFTSTCAMLLIASGRRASWYACPCFVPTVTATTSSKAARPKLVTSAISAKMLSVFVIPFNPLLLFTHYWGAYTRHLDPDEHHPGKRNTQQIECKHLTLRTRIKRLTHKTICFSRSSQMHDIVSGLFVNRYACGLPVCNRKVHIWNMTQVQTSICDLHP
jgi:IS1 transposase